MTHLIKIKNRYTLQIFRTWDIFINELMKMTVNIHLDQNMFTKHKRYYDVKMLVNRNLTFKKYFNLNIYRDALRLV